MDCELDVATGEVIHEVTDFQFVSPIPVRLTRRYVSSYQQRGRLGWGWMDNFAASLDLSKSAVKKLDPIDGDTVFPREQCDGNRGPLIEYPTQYHLLLTYPDRTQETYLTDLDHPARWRLIKIADQNGNWLIYHYDSNVLMRIESRLIDLTFAYDYSGLLAEMSVTRGQTASPPVRVVYEHDGNQDLVGWGGNSTEPVQCFYQDHLLVRIGYPQGAANYVYAAGRRCVGSWRDGDYLIRRLQYDDVRRRTLISDSYGEKTLLGTTTGGAVSSHVDAEGNVTERLLDPQGAIFANLLADGSVTLGDAYDAATSTLRTPDGAGNMWLRQLDSRGRLKKVISPLGAAKEYQYDGEDRVTEIREWNGGVVRYRYDREGEIESFRDESGYEIHRRLEEDGRRLRLYDAEGTLFQQTFDDLDQVFSDVDANGRETRYAYYALDTPGMEVRPGGAVERYEYDAALNLVAVTGPLGAVQRFEYDAIGNIRTAIEPDGGIIRYEYDLEGRRTNVVNQKGERLELRYNDIGEEIEWRGFDGKILRFEYDPLRRREAVIDALGQRTTLTHQGCYDIRSRTFPDGALESFALTPDGQLASVALTPPVASGEPLHLSKFTYNDAAKVVEEIHDGTSLQFEWDAANYLVAIRDSLGDETRYERGGRHRVETMIDLGRVYAFRYMPTGEILEIRYPNGLRQVFDYDAAGRMSRRRMLSAGGDVLTWRRFEYDLADQLTAMEDWHWGAFRYSYDANGRILEARDNKGAVVERYQYDQTGNLIEGPLAGNVVVAPGNRITASAAERFDYDADGNLIARHGFEEWRYEWDRDGNVKKVFRGGHLVAEYDYDRFNRRTRKTTPQGSTSFLYDGIGLRAETLADGTRNHYVTLPELPIHIAAIHGSEHFYYSYDQIGTPVEVFNEQGELILAVHAQAFGGSRQEFRPTGSSVTLPFHFLGQYRDQESDLFYNIFRYYDPRLGRYISQDPLRLCAGLNFYVYPQNPFTNGDPDGRRTAYFTCMAHWGACQKWYAKEKVAAINESTHARNTCTCCRANAQKRDFVGKKCSKNGKRGRAYKGRAIDHMHELQAGGPDRCCSNLKAVEKVFNGELGTQTAKMLKTFKNKEVITKAMALNCESDDECSDEGKKNVAIPPPAGSEACKKKDDKPLSCKC